MGCFPGSVMLKFVIFLVIVDKSLGDVNNKLFPPSFMFGVASAAYQIEGAWDADGKGESIWDNFTHSFPDKILDGRNGDVAADSYNHCEEDVQLLKDLNVSHFRLSLSWPRILPKGFKDEVNQAGIEHYQKLIKLLKENGIEPVVTLYHWDLPQVLQDHGGFLNESMVDWFTDYANISFQAFGDNVKYWSTFNEPRIFCSLGYGLGLHAPGLTLNTLGEYVCGHNVLKAHSKVWHLYNDTFKANQGGGISMNMAIDYYGPASNSSEDVAAADQALQFYLGIWAHPLYFGDYPEIVKTRIANRSKLEGLNQSRLPEFTEEEKSYIAGTLDYFSFNTYNSYLVHAIPEANITTPPTNEDDVGVGIVESNDPNGAWGVLPLLKWIQNEYNDPHIIITENGSNGTVAVEDDDRISYIRDYLSGIRDAIDEGVKIFGYTVWTMMDDMEWNNGYTLKYGLHHVDFDNDSRTRTPRKSAIWYKNVISTSCLSDVCLYVCEN